MNKDDFELDPLNDPEYDHIKSAIRKGCELGVKAETDMKSGKTHWLAFAEGSFVMHIAAVAELIKYVSIKQAKKFERTGQTANDDGTPTAWETIAETLIVSSAAFLGFEVRVVGKCDLRKKSEEDLEDMSKYKEI